MCPAVNRRSRFANEAPHTFFSFPQHSHVTPDVPASLKTEVAYGCQFARSGDIAVAANPSTTRSGGVPADSPLPKTGGDG